jgi:hypothetical protein
METRLSTHHSLSVFICTTQNSLCSHSNGRRLTDYRLLPHRSVLKLRLFSTSANMTSLVFRQTADGSWTVAAPIPRVGDTVERHVSACPPWSTRLRGVVRRIIDDAWAVVGEPVGADDTPAASADADDEYWPLSTVRSPMASPPLSDQTSPPSPSSPSSSTPVIQLLTDSPAAAEPISGGTPSPVQSPTAPLLPHHADSPSDTAVDALADALARVSLPPASSQHPCVSRVSVEPSPTATTTSTNRTSTPIEKTVSTGIIYARETLLHKCSPECTKPELHPESPDRIHKTVALLAQHGLIDMCTQLVPREATAAEMQLVHSADYVQSFLLPQTSTEDTSDDHDKHMPPRHLLRRAECGCWTQAKSPYDDAPMCFPFTPLAARFACGSTLQAVDAVMTGSVRNAFALVRPPGHHAMCSHCEGFCYVNNVAVAARHAQQAHSAKRVMIIDWDIHHGDGTQDMFYSDENVLYMSLHRYDNGQ